MDARDPGQLAAVVPRLRQWAAELGFAGLRIGDLELGEAAGHLRRWLAEGRHGDMSYMARHARLRTDPQQLLAGALRVITVRMDYLPAGSGANWRESEQSHLAQSGTAVVALYARGRDYHKVMRQRLARLAGRLEQEFGAFNHRACVDSAPVMEVELARRAGLGWRGKHTLLLTREAGSMFFLGEILTDLPLPVDPPVSEHCGQCEACIRACPTAAIVAPFQLDARRCIAYLTIEHAGPIAEALRPLIGNRIYGCDDCQLACPWNKFAQRAVLPDFAVRHGLDAAALVELFAWTEDDFRQRHAGSAILRIGYERWRRNLAIALGNAAPDPAARGALQAAVADPSPLVREHVAWALAQHRRTPI